MTPTMWHAGVPEDLWDQKQQTLDAHFLQGRAWAAFQKTLGRPTFYAFCDGWSWIAILEHGKFGSRLYCPYGPTATSDEALRAAFTALISCAKAQGASYIRIEPQGSITGNQHDALGLLPAHRNIQPRFTLVKNLARDEADLLAEMSATNRNLHRTATKKGISFRESKEPRDVRLLLNMLHEVASHNQIQVHSDEYFTTMAETLLPLGAAKLYIANIDGQPAAASLVFDSATTRYYAHAAAHYDSRKLHPGTPLLVHMILTAKSLGKTKFDFNGIAPPNQPDHPWAGFTKFKQSFGGAIVDFGGTWELPVKKLNHKVYQLLTKLGA